MVVGSFTSECETSISVERLWKAGVQDAHNLMPKLLSHTIKSVEVIQGDGGVGTIKQLNFTEVVPEYSYTKDRIDVIDHANHVFKYTIFEGGVVGKRVKWYSFELKYEPTAAGGCTQKVKVEYDSIDGTFPTDDEAAGIKHWVSEMVTAMETYLKENPNAYV
ncbi:Major pollen allergen Bet v 1-D/H [Acorus calamus]|uniref:Major pollen allergen Bet v 1-D/H n=1 Tax=Acorus calamus TaxID=4465 RepID=A0AAV9D3B8_ACOCL|nr:Major pollen allergen Bet v 1-D/H [Acorus calamus]